MCDDSHETEITKSWHFFFFLVLSSLYWIQMVNFKENYHFSRFRRGSNIFQVGGGGGPTFSRGGGGVQLLIPYRNPYNLWFSRGGRGSGHPVPHSGSTLVQIWHFIRVYTICYGKNNLRGYKNIIWKIHNGQSYPHCINLYGKVH